MTQQLNAQVFAYAKQLADSAFKAQSVALKGLEQIAELQIRALEKQSEAAADFISGAFETRDADGLRVLWDKAAAGGENAERAVSVTQEIIAVTQKTAESLGALVQEQQLAANDAVAAPVAAVKKAAAAASAK